jgi:tetratricopeptide (TPR) repeat protein
VGVHKIDYCKERYNLFLEETKQCPFGISWYKIEIQCELIFWEALYGNPQEGLESADQALIAAIKRDDIFAQGNILMLKGFNYYALEQFSKAEEVFSQAIEKLVKSGAKLHFFISLLGRAEVVHQQGRIEEFRVDMKQAISYLKNNPDKKFILNRTSRLIRDSNLIIDLFNKARSAGVAKSYINEIFQQNKLNKVEHTPPYMLKIKCFANLRLFRGQEAVLGDEWKRKSAKDLLKLFLVNYGEFISKEKICSLL